MSFAAALTLLPMGLCAAAQVQPHTLQVGPTKRITLSLPASFDIAVAAVGLPRVRFMAQSPDNRIFATSMYDLADNTRGAVYILEGYDARTHRFTRVTPYLKRLRNPNNLAFYTDDAGQTWLYLPLTDRLVRYRYAAGDMQPSAPPETLMRFPDYGLNYKYGGWHLTRTVTVAKLHGRTRIYVSAGSSCNYCEEHEAQRASVMAMDPDGGHPQIVAHGMRNAVDLRFVPELDGGALFATNMGDDHLGDTLPEDTFFELDSNDHAGPIAMPQQEQHSPANYGWPACYFAGGKAVHDETPLPGQARAEDIAERPVGPINQESVYAADATRGTAEAGTNLPAQIVNGRDLPELGPVPRPLRNCDGVPAAYTTFAAHSSPLGLAYFGAESPLLRGHFLVALHGAGHPRIGTGYRLVEFSAEDRTPRDFMTGYLTRESGKLKVSGRPCGMLRIAPDTFLLSDDYSNTVYVVFPKR